MTTPIDHDELGLLLRAIGMKAYVEILFPAMMRDRDISVSELCLKYPKFKEYTSAAQNTRRSKARKIFNNGWQDTLRPDRLGSVAIYGEGASLRKAAIDMAGLLFGHRVAFTSLEMGRRLFVDVRFAG